MKELIEIQKELKAPKSQYNAFGKYHYRSCEDILEAVKPLAAKQGCTVTITDEVKEIGGLVFIEATASIQKGDGYIEVKAQAGINPDRKGMDIAQSFGSSSSYARKYALNGLFLIDDTKDADAMQGKEQQKQAKPTMPDSAIHKAIEGLKQGKVTMQEIEKKYTLTEAQKKQLTNL